MLKFFIIPLALLSVPAFSNYYCTGKVVHLGSDSSLYMSNGYGVHKLCSLTEDKCKMWASFLTTAKVTGKTVSVYYTHSSIGGEQKKWCL